MGFREEPMNTTYIPWLLIFACSSLLLCAAGREVRGQSAPPPLGLFENHADIGTVLHPGSVEFDASKQSYTISGSGENVWFTSDAFHFVWKKINGDFSLTADI